MKYISFCNFQTFANEGCVIYLPGQFGEVIRLLKGKDSILSFVMFLQVRVDIMAQNLEPYDFQRY
jgi:hypothetical protein